MSGAAARVRRILLVMNDFGWAGAEKQLYHLAARPLRGRPRGDAARGRRLRNGHGSAGRTRDRDRLAGGPRPPGQAPRAARPRPACPPGGDRPLHRLGRDPLGAAGRPARPPPHCLHRAHPGPQLPGQRTGCPARELDRRPQPAPQPLHLRGGGGGGVAEGDPRGRRGPRREDRPHPQRGAARGAEARSAGRPGPRRSSASPTAPGC